jgi:hypothetical protein
MTGISSYILRFRFGFRYSFQALWSALAGAVILSVSFTVFLTVNLVTSPVGWEQSVTVSPAGITVKSHQVVSRGSLVMVLYEGGRGKENGVFVQVSRNSGERFGGSAALAVSTQSDAFKIPKSPNGAISRDGRCVAVWQEYEDSSSRFILKYTQSADFGDSWDAPKTINPGTDLALIPKILFDGDNRLHLFFHSFNADSFNLFHSVMNDDGSFSAAEPIARLPGEMRGAFFPSFAVSGNYIFAVWQGKELVQNRLTDDIYFMRSSNNGRSFSSPDRITESEASDASPYILADNGVLYVVYENNSNKNWEIRLIKSIDRGDRWDRPVTISSTNVSAYAPSVTPVSSDELAVFWYDSRDVVNRIHSRRFFPADSHMSKEMSISEGKDGAVNPAALSGDGRLFSLWLQGGRIRGKFSDAYAPPPAVSSRTHPDGKWVKTSDAVIQWTIPPDESGIAGFATLITTDPDTNPTVQNLNASSRSETIPGVADGENYYHIRMIDGAGNYSRTIHFPLRISKSPLPIPIVESKTHPEKKSVQSGTPQFDWQMSELPRVKGFMYALSPNPNKRPDTFTEKLSASFAGLTEGRYFFRVQAVDKTNTPGRIADYEIVVGQAKEFNPEEYKTIEDTGGEEIEKRKPVVRQAKAVILEPSQDAEIFGKFVLNMRSEIPSGAKLDRYFYQIERDAKVVARGSFRGSSGEISVPGTGLCELSVKARFTAKPGAKPSETPFAKIRLTVLPFPAESPFDELSRVILDAVQSHILLPIALVLVAVPFLAVKSNRRFLFAVMRRRYRIRLLLKRVFEKS